MGIVRRWEGRNEPVMSIGTLSRMGKRNHGRGAQRDMYNRWRRINGHIDKSETVMGHVGVENCLDTRKVKVIAQADT